MDSNFEMKNNDSFDKYFQEALVIRAICDDFNFPSEYSPVFVNIHIRGPEHFKSPPLPLKYYKIVFDFLDPASDDRMKNTILEMEDTPLKEQLNNLYIKDKVKEMDDLLKKNGAKSDYLAKQIKMIKNLYFNTTFMEHMVALYIFFVKPFMKEYNSKKISRAFRKGIIRDINQELNDCKQDDFPEY